MVFVEQFLEMALLVRIAHGHDFDFSEARRGGFGDWRGGRFFTFHPRKVKSWQGFVPPNLN